jgi:hypothetical protein
MKIVTRCHYMLYGDDIVHRDYLLSLKDEARNNIIKVKEILFNR